MERKKDIEFLSKITPSAITETEDSIQFDVVALSACTVDRRYKTEDGKEGTYKLGFEPDDIQKAAPSLAKSPLYTDHIENIDNTRGIVLSAEYDPENTWIKARLQVAKAGNERLVSLVKMNPSPINNFSASLFLNKVKVSDGMYLAKDIVFKGLSIVTQGADSRASRLSYDDLEEPTKEDSMPAGELEKLQQEISKSTEQLSAATARIAVLEAEKKELSDFAVIGKKYKEQLSADVKKAIIIVDGKDAAILEMLETAQVETLEKLKADYWPKFQKKLQPSSREALGLADQPVTPEELSKEKLNSMSFEQLMEYKEKFRKESDK